MNLLRLWVLPMSNKRKGRGTGTGNGKTAGRGHKGQKARSRRQAPHRLRRRPDASGTPYPEARLQQHLRKAPDGRQRCGSNEFEDGAVVDAAALIEKGILQIASTALKVLGNGSVSKKVTVKAAAFSESAKEKIEKAGGKAEVV